MYGIGQENLYVDTGALRLKNVLELADTFLSDHHLESHNNHQPEGQITHVTRKVRIIRGLNTLVTETVQ